jgi:transposase-like protein
LALGYGINADLAYNWRSQAEMRKRFAAVSVDAGFVLAAIAAPAAPILQPRSGLSFEAVP